MRRTFGLDALGVLSVSLLEGGIGIRKKPQNRTNNNRKPQNRNKFRSKPKAANNIREDVHAVEVVIFSEGGTEKNTKLHRIANQKTENREPNRTETAIVTKTGKRKFFLAQKPKNRSKKLPKPKIPILPSFHQNKFVQ